MTRSFLAPLTHRAYITRFAAFPASGWDLGRVSDTTKERIRERIDMVSLVSEYVSLQQRGPGDFWGRCPFHEERSASFHILPGKGLFKCFGCGKGGDVFRFVEEIEGIRFSDALRRLGERAGVTLELASPQERAREERRSALLRATSIVAEFYAEVLWSATPAGERGRAALAQRGISAETARAFGLGVAPPEWDGLQSLAQARRLDEEVLLELGLLRRGQGGQGRAYAFFRDRLMFPIRNEQGKAVAFGGRTLGDDERKYMNSPEVPGLYEKRRLLYGLDAAKKARPKRLVVVEGYMDVVVPHQAGHPEFVAALGTAFTLEQARLARRFVDEVVLLFDADEAGAGATLRALANLVGEQGLTVRVARLPDGLDPDEAVRQDPALLERALAEADDLLSFIIDRSLIGYSLSSPAGQERAVRAAIKLLAKIPDRIRLFRELGQVAQRFGLPEAVLREELSRQVGRDAADEAGQQRRRGSGGRASRGFGSGTGTASMPPTPGPAAAEKEVHVLEALLWEPSAASAALERGAGPHLFTPGATQRVAAAIFSAAQEGSVEPARVMGRLEEPEDRSLCELLIGRYDEDKNYTRDAHEGIEALERHGRDLRVKQITRELREARDAARKRLLLTELNQLRSEVRAASAGADVRSPC